MISASDNLACILVEHVSYHTKGRVLATDNLFTADFGVLNIKEREIE